MTSLTILTKWYDLQLTDDQKYKLVDGLLLVDDKLKKSTDGSFLSEIPSLVLCMHWLMTEKNRGKICEVVRTLSVLYLTVIG